MTPDQSTDLVRRWIALAEAGFRGDFGEFIAADYVGHLGERVMDRAELERAELAFLAAFPDTRHTIEDLVAVDDRVVIRLTMRATHEAEFYGILRTGRAVEFTAPSCIAFATAGSSNRGARSTSCGLSVSCVPDVLN